MNSELARRILTLFRGRHDHVAFDDGAHFAPKKLASPIGTRWFAKTHLAQVNCLGFYVLTERETCWCTCVDFDDHDGTNGELWTEVERLYHYLTAADVTPLVERSQSGNGAHVWLFFSSEAPAALVRAWWAGVADAMGTKFDEVFPKQSTLTGKGLGNLIRYPLWEQSAFVDPENEFAELDPSEALDGVRTVDPVDMTYLAFELGIGSLETPDEPEFDEDGLPRRVAKLLANKHTLLARRWGGDVEGLGEQSGSRSALAQSICCELVRCYVPTHEIEVALRRWCAIQSYEKGHRDDWVELTVSKAYEFVSGRQARRSATTLTMRGGIEAYLDQLAQGKRRYFGSGIGALDHSIDGVGPAEVCVIAARPGHGKTAVGVQWVEHVSSLGVPSLVISEEMSAAELGRRRLKSLSIEPDTGWGPSHVEELRKVAASHYENLAPIYVAELCSTISRVEEVVDQFVEWYGVKLVMLDYVQLLSGDTKVPRHEQVADISRRVKRLAMKHDVAFLLLSQLNRESEKEGRDAMMADLRESGQIEQDADLIVFLKLMHKTPAPKGKPPWPKDEYRILCAKRRNGPIRRQKVVCRFDTDRQVIW